MTGHIKVKFNNSNHLVFTDENGNVPLENLKEAVPSADGLQYREQVPPFALMKLPCANGLIKLITNVNEYEAFSSKSFAKMDEMVNKIKNARGCKSSDRQLCQNTALYTSSEMEKSLIGSRKKIPKLSHPKKIKIGFLYQAKANEPYKSMRKMTGGVKYTELMEGQFYNAQQIMDAGIAVYSSPIQNKNYFEFVLNIINASKLRVGDAEGYEDADFNLDHSNYGFWEFLVATNTPPSKLTLYILAEKKPAADDPIVYNMKMIENQKQSKFLEQHNLEGNADELVAEESEHVVMDGNQQDINGVQDGDQIVLENNVNVAVEENIDQIDVFYQTVTWSKYTGMPSITECNFEEAYNYVQASNPECPEFSEFDPLDHGFRICKIYKNHELLLDITMDENVGSYDFKFPAIERDLLNREPHSYLYDCSQLVGQLEDGSFGVGCITFCDSSCEPTFKWKKNGVLYKAQRFLYVVRTDFADGVIWTCEVYCKHSKLNRYLKTPSISLPSAQPISDETHETNPIDEKQASTSTESLQNSEYETVINSIQNSAGNAFDQVLTIEDVSNIVIVDKKKLNVCKAVLRQVGQMKERNGVYLGTEVSVKSYQFDEGIIALIKNEIGLSKIIKHPNVIMLMGMAIEPKTLHFVTEHFEAQLLFDALFDEATNNYMKLNVDKKIVVSKQISQAITYIHEQALICKNITPFNILINENYQVKIRDIGIDASLKDKMYDLKLYEAPEIVVRHKPETRASDTWSLACVLFEMFSGTRVFVISNNNNDNFKNHLKDLMEIGQKPKVSLVFPKYLQAIIDPCFDYDAIERPQVSTILQHFLTK